MRAIVLHALAVLLIAIFAIGSPPPAKADCDKCQDCSAQAPSRDDGPCPGKALACPIGQACASQVQKAPVQIEFDGVGEASRAAFGWNSPIAIKQAYRTPETAPPRA